MKWTKLENASQLDLIKNESTDKTILIFKHSTRCNVSRTALDRLERNWKEEEMRHVTPYFLDLISYREISNQIVSQFGVEHESPQILVVRNGKTVYDCSHFDISYDTIRNIVLTSKN